MSLQCKSAANLLQVRPMVTSKLALTCCKLVSHLHSCRDKFAVSLQICSASLLQTKIAIWEGAEHLRSSTTATISKISDDSKFTSRIPVYSASYL
ncbi:hypothetical protein AVEN_153175-1 [Araneus ventricosus]|uniref:Uncharacterized protein n=1 Tax=Araneus ventricosus TaxID=182803 RepID=A0A4Y2L8V8_ARAVE|nr:hypothetical protein AVEN_153175-1 [Araneus ventricosus]